MGTLEIHQINVSQGDSILIINRNLEKVGEALDAKDNTLRGTTDPIDWVPMALGNDVSLDGTVNRALLIDGGDDAYGGDVVDYLERHGCTYNPNTTALPRFCPFLNVLVSHFHDDHMAGLRSVFKWRDERSCIDPSTGKTTTRVEFPERYRPAIVYRTARDDNSDPATLRYEWLTSDINTAQAAAVAKERTRVIHIDRGGFMGPGQTPDAAFEQGEIPLGFGVDNIPIRLYVMAASQAVYQIGRAPEAVLSRGNSVDQNDRSIVLILEYGSFRYFLGGDIAGNGVEAGGNTGANKMDTTKKRFTSMHGDVETPLSRALMDRFPAVKARRSTADQAKYPNPGYCTIAKANHHASSSSDDVFFLSTIRPKIAVISSGLRARFHHHPTQEVINRMSRSRTWGIRGGRPGDMTPNTIEQVYVTECAQVAKGRNFDVTLSGARILGDIIIRPTDLSIRNIHAATSPGTPLAVQVYGTGEQSLLEAPYNVARPPEAANPTTPPYYPIGPWIHQDIH